MVRRKNRKKAARRADQQRRPAATGSGQRRVAPAQLVAAGGTIELREEELLARSRTVQAGVVRVTTEVVTEQRTLEATVAHEEVFLERRTLERRPADRAIGGGGQTWTIPVYGERVVMSKQPVVVEEITVDTEVVRDIQHLEGRVRHEELDVERRESRPGAGDTREPGEPTR